MAENTEQAVKDALRSHHDGLGPHLSNDMEQEIIDGRANEAENKTHVDGDKLCQCAEAALQRHPVEWILK